MRAIFQGFKLRPLTFTTSDPISPLFILLLLTNIFQLASLQTTTLALPPLSVSSSSSSSSSSPSSSSSMILSETVEEFPFNLTDAMKSFSESSKDIIPLISKWFSYDYDSTDTPSMIKDGGHDMFDSGNFVTVLVDGTKVEDVTYNKYYQYGTLEFTSVAAHPFMILLKIDNSDSLKSEYSIKVSGDTGADENGKITKFNGYASSRNYTIEYHVFQISDADDPTICEVYFILYSAKKWHSVKPSYFHLMTGVSTNDLENTAIIGGNPKQLLMGYTLLSRFPTAVITEKEVRDVMEKYLQLFTYGICETGKHNCDKNAVCRNYLNDYSCMCNPGFYGNGTICKDIDECKSKSKTKMCDKNSVCVNEFGNYTCACNEGFTKVGTKCVDLNECSFFSTSCHRNASCVNKNGGYSCKCNPGFFGNGTHCKQMTDFFHVDCKSESMNVRVRPDYFLSKNIKLNELHLQDYSCRGFVDEIASDIWFFHIQTLSSCGTILSSNSTHLVYTNSISNAFRGNLVYTGTVGLVTFSCIYEKRLDNSRMFSNQFGVVQNVVNLTVPSTQGQFLATLNHFTDDKYSRVENKSVFETTDTLFIQINLQTNDPTLHLLIDSCWVTPSPNHHDKSNYMFIKDRCPMENETEEKLKVTRNGNGSIATFNSQVLAFIDYDVTYLHCSLSVCSSIRGESCIPPCSVTVPKVNGSKKNESSRTKRRAPSNGNVVSSELLSVGPFYLIKDPNTRNIQPKGKRGSYLPSAFMVAFIVAFIAALGACFVFLTFWLRLKRRFEDRMKCVEIDRGDL